MTDPLSPRVNELLAAWHDRVAADKAQVERSREEADPTDFYAPTANRFRMDPRRTDDASLNALLALARADDAWLDIGAGGGRFALPLALAVNKVIGIEPSPAMLSALGEDAAANGIANLEIIESRWPMDEPPSADVALMAHVGYDIAEIGPFLDQAEQSASRLCVAVMGESAMATTATLFWSDVHGEPRVRLPALPELLALLAARGQPAAVAYVERVPPTFESFDEALAMARRQLWVRAGSAKDELLVKAAREIVSERDGRFAFEWQPTRIGIVSWPPR